MEQNAKHLLKLWVPAFLLIALVLCLMIFGVASGLRRGDYLPIGSVAGGLVVTCGSILWTRRRVLGFFKDRTPDRAISFYHSSAKQLSNAKAMAAYQSAFAALLYGQFDRARTELAVVNWVACPPMYQGLETYIHSLLAMLEAADYPRALSLAEEARDLCTVSDTFPGVKKSRYALEMHINACQLLAGKNDSGLVTQLDEAIKKLPGVSPVLPAWALFSFFSKFGDDNARAKYAGVISRLLPHGALSKPAGAH